jgi:hypothetical protein
VILGAIVLTGAADAIAAPRVGAGEIDGGVVLTGAAVNTDP